MKKLVKIMLTLTGCFAALIITANVIGIRFNITKSYPLGFYQMTNDPVAKGAMVIFCPVANSSVHEAVKRGYISAGFCPGGSGAMIKKILAAQDDKVKITTTGVFVNGKLLPNSKPMKADSDGRSLPAIEIDNVMLDNHTVLLMSDYSHKSFDARYFGLIDKSHIISTIRPLWIF